MKSVFSNVTYLFDISKNWMCLIIFKIVNFLLAHSIFDIVVQINDLILFPVSTMLPFPFANTI